MPIFQIDYPYISRVSLTCDKYKASRSSKYLVYTMMELNDLKLSLK